MPYDYGQAQQRIANLSSLREAIAKQQPTHYGAGGLNLLAQIIASQGQKKAREEARQAQQGFTSAILQDVQGAPAQGVHDLQGPMPTGEAIQGQAYEVAPVAPKGLAEALMARGAEFGMPEMSQAGLMQVLSQSGGGAPEYSNVRIDDLGRPWGINSQTNQMEQIPMGEGTFAKYKMVETVTPQGTIQRDFVPITGETDELPTVKAGEKKPTFSGDESKAASFFGRMTDVENIMDELSQTDFDPTSAEAAILFGLDEITPDIISRSAMSPEQKRYAAAATNFVLAQLRRESGAAISGSELKSGYENYFPKFGDDPKTVEDKRQNRIRAMQNMYREGRKPLEYEGVEMPDFNKAASPQQDDVQSAIDEARAAGATDEEIKAITGEL